VRPVLGVFPQALHHGTDESDDWLQYALSDGGVRGGEADVDGGGELLVLHHDQQLGLRGRVQVKSAVRNVGPVGDLLCRDPADAVFGEQFAGCGHDALALGLFGPLAAPDRHVAASHGTSLDNNPEQTHS